MPMTYDQFRQLNLRLDMSRGKPSPEQLDLSYALIEAVGMAGYLSPAGIDCRNYGYGAGLPEMRAFGGQLLGLPAAQVFAAGNSSLELMHDALAFAMLHGVPHERAAGGRPTPWSQLEDVAFLCPVPGYDRHFAICETLGIRMINVPMEDDGPDLDFVEAQLLGDPAIRGMWCVPLYSNPTGAVWSAQKVERLAQLPAAADFRLFWDDAYRFHHLTATRHATPDIVPACARAGHPDRAIVFASLSKVTIGGGAVAFFASSPRNVDWWTRLMAIRTIGPDKLNQLRHLRFLPDRAALEALMERHRALIQPKFAAVQRIFGELLGAVPGVSWNEPQGGYFISLYVPPGLAKRTVALAAEAGLVLTPAGAAFPYGRDPYDSHLRIAPTFPSLDEVRLAAQGIALSVLRAIEEAEVNAHA